MFEFKDWITIFQMHLAETGTAYNDAESYGVIIDSPENRIWRVLGIHHLTPDENRGNRNVFVEMLCKQNERDGFRAIQWTWEGRHPSQPAPPAFAGTKGPDELVDLPLNLGMSVSVWTGGSGIAEGFNSNHPDELGPNGEGWNTVGHHSFFVCFQEIDQNEPIPQPPTPEPQEAVMLIKKSWLDNQEIDDNGFIRIKG